MTQQQGIILGVLIAALALFIWGRWRYDLVALAAVLVLVVGGIIPAEEAFAGFGHPAVVTVAAVLVISRGLINSGVVELLAKSLSRIGNSPTIQIATLTGLVAICSGFMNNVGALALLMPVAISLARQEGRPPSLLLMPLAFGSLLGGLTTLIGSPPNIIVSSFRTQATLPPFSMFDFFPVGIGLVLVGVIFMSTIGWRLLPARKGQPSPEELFQIEAYVTEVQVPPEAKLVGQTIYFLENNVVKDAEISVLGLIRQQQRLMAPSAYYVIQAGDILLLEADPDSLKKVLDASGLQLAESKSGERLNLGSDAVDLVEVVVAADSRLLGRTAAELDLRRAYGLNLLAVARQGQQVRERLSHIPFAFGDILLFQGEKENLQERLSELNCLPLASRGLRLDKPPQLILAAVIFLPALLLAALNILSVQIALVAAAVSMVWFGLVRTREVYSSIDWPIIVLLGAMMPLGTGLEKTGTTQLLADQILVVGRALSPALTLAVVLTATMLLSNVINNAAAAVLMAPISLKVAQGLGTAVDPFLMAVVVGASSAFLTPIGHQSNTLVWAPGGYRFSDYLRLGLPLSVLILVAAGFLILVFWPLNP
jgi:di/tricarboxylate transporter